MRDLVWILVVAGVFSCRGREISLYIPFEEERLVIWGKLEAGRPVAVRLTKTFPPKGDLPENLSVNNATVVLFRNGSRYAALNQSSDEGVYVCDSIVLPGQSYVLKAEAEGFPAAESQSVIVPASPPEVSYLRKTDAERLPLYPYRQDLISLFIHGKSVEADCYLMVGFLAHFENNNTKLPLLSRAGFPPWVLPRC